MHEGRRRYGALSLLLVVAMLVSVFTADASARHYSKAQKSRIGKKLMRDVKRSHGRVLAKRQAAAATEKETVIELPAGDGQRAKQGGA